MRKLVEKLMLKKNNDSKIKNKPRRAPLAQINLSEGIDLNPIYESSQCDIDVIAIHGDGGHYEDSWTHPETKIFWLHDLLPQVIPRSRILSFGYRASKSSSRITSTEDIASTLLTEILELRIKTGSTKRPILFLAHSFGVIILKGALVNSSTSSSNFNDIFLSTLGILFFGTPPGISHGLKALLATSARKEIKETPQVSTLRKDVEWLQFVTSEFEKLEAIGGPQIVYFLESPYEEPKDGESLHHEEEDKIVRMGKSHGMMVRFPNAEDQDFQKVEKYLKKAAQPYLLQ